MKFKFRLQTQLKINEQRRAEAQAELAKAQDAEQIVETELKRIQTEIADCADQARRSMQEGRIDVNFLLGLRRHEMVLVAQQGEATEQLNIVRQEVEKRRLFLMEKDREVKTLEKLKEKQFEAFKEEHRRAEAKQMDEIAGQRVKSTQGQ